MFVGCPIQQSVDIRYYVIVVLFLIFELEVILLLAWLGSSTSSVYSGGLQLYLILMLGFLYEYQKGTFNWVCGSVHDHRRNRRQFNEDQGRVMIEQE